MIKPRTRRERKRVRLDAVPGHTASIEPALLRKGGAVKRRPEHEKAEGAAAHPHLGKRKRGGGIHIKPSHEGLLHRDLGVPEGKPIPAAKMERAKADADPAEKKRIVFAENAKRWRHT